MRPRRHVNIHYWRADFATYLRSKGVVRAQSHEVAQDPKRKWWFIVCGDGMIRVADNAPTLRYRLERAQRYCDGVVALYTIRWKHLPGWDVLDNPLDSAPRTPGAAAAR